MDIKMNDMEKWTDSMTEKTLQARETESAPVVDAGLISYFLKLSPEGRLQANDNAIRAILELRNAFKQQSADSR